MSPHEDTDRLSAPSLAAGDPTGWFDKLYVEAQHGTARVPWDRPEPTALLAEWARRTMLTGAGRRALVVGCGLGRDAEFLAGLGFATTAFDISETAVRVARERHPGSPVDYRVADLLAPPEEWARAFDLVVESNNVQALPRSLRAPATASVVSFVAPGGTLLVVAAAATRWGEEGPPWPLTREDIAAFAAVTPRDGAERDALADGNALGGGPAAANPSCRPAVANPSGPAVASPGGGPAVPSPGGDAAADGLTEVSVEELPAEDDPLVVRWRAVFTRSR